METVQAWAESVEAWANDIAERLDRSSDRLVQWFSQRDELIAQQFDNWLNSPGVRTFHDWVKSPLVQEFRETGEWQDLVVFLPLLAPEIGTIEFARYIALELLASHIGLHFFHENLEHAAAEAALMERVQQERGRIEQDNQKTVRQQVERTLVVTALEEVLSTMRRMQTHRFGSHGPNETTAPADLDIFHFWDWVKDEVQKAARCNLLDLPYPPPNIQQADLYEQQYLYSRRGDETVKRVLLTPLEGNAEEVARLWALFEPGADEPDEIVRLLTIEEVSWTGEILHAAIPARAKRARQVALLAVVNGLSTEEIAARLGLNKTTVRGLRAQYVKYLRKYAKMHPEKLNAY